MNPAHIHLLLNHVPVIGVTGGFFLLLLGIAKKDHELRRVSLGVFLLVSLLTIPTYLTGEPAGDVVEHLPGVSKSAIEEHEDAAIPALVSVLGLGALAAVGLFLSRRSRTLPRWNITACLIVAAVSCVILGWTANLGGQIRHSEIRSDSPAVPYVDEDHEDERP